MLTVLIAIGIFASLLLMLHAGYAVYAAVHNPETKRIKQRLKAWSTSRSPAAPAPNIIRRRVLSEVQWLNAVLGRLPRLDAFNRLLEQADTRLPLGLFLLLSTLLALTGFLLSGIATPRAPVRLAVAMAAALLPFAYLYGKKTKRNQAFQRQLPDALDLVARALRAGHPFVVGMKMVGEEFSPPVGSEFDRTVEEITFGVDVTTALKNLTERMDSADLKFFVTSVIVQRETGGNLAEVIESLAAIIRKRFELQGRVKALAAEGKLSAMILFSLPFLLALAIALVNREYLGVLFVDPIGHILLIGGGLLMVLGIVTTRTIITIRV